MVFPVGEKHAELLNQLEKDNLASTVSSDHRPNKLNLEEQLSHVS
jgi:hypothetical protein